MGMFEVIFEHALQSIELDKDITIETMTTLNLLFPQSLKESLQIIESGLVSRISTANGCYYHTVASTANSSHVILPNSCSCRAHAQQVVETKTEFMCKHLLAVEIASRLPGAEQSTVVPTDQWSKGLLALLWPQ
ncbi:Zinc-finger SWIM domain-containing protein 7 [Carpediemonas membranifera]|uniref:Zinc-finger SWIM domain-containing protein 7 n=1 Tax=Carpediemonas membranifera TaxID=201153 RepID=A0A8J6BUV2_9EUKA|nr:Zinc-finger SWIM domain-containing protein 7 [Carpediemonas membranifera]|eukprot:KAG9390741.1 Zinc-finger SWIM domain-containing protein 7 [Carpediemonas membranifera]